MQIHVPNFFCSVNEALNNSEKLKAELQSQTEEAERKVHLQLSCIKILFVMYLYMYAE